MYPSAGIGRSRRFRVLNCRQFTEVVTDYLESSRDEDVRRACLEHLSTCPQCRLYLSQIQTVISLLRRLPEEILERQPD